MCPCVAPRACQVHVRCPNVICTLGQNLARYPRTSLEVGWWLHGFRRASSTVLVQRACHRHVAPCVVCVLGLSQLVVLAAARRPPQPTPFGDFPRKDALDAWPPPPASRHAQSGNQSHDLSVARPTLSPVELAADPCTQCVRDFCHSKNNPSSAWMVLRQDMQNLRCKFFLQFAKGHDQKIILLCAFLFANL